MRNVGAYPRPDGGHDDRGTRGRPGRDGGRHSKRARGTLSAPTAITITEDPSGPPPPYVPLSPLYRFAPDGLTFTKPVSIAFSTTSSSPVGNVYWSLASGPGYEALPTTWVGTTASALVTHFSSGFVGTLPNDGAVDTSGGDAASAQDATVSDGGTPEGATMADAPEPQDRASDGRAPADDGAILDAGSTYVWGILRTVPPGPRPPWRWTNCLPSPMPMEAVRRRN